MVMVMRENLIELINRVQQNGVIIQPSQVDDRYVYKKDIPNAKVADNLIANGVTIQRWIPVTERLPTEEEADDDGFVFAYTIANKKIIARWTDVCRFSVLVTHWMPLPDPPKGE